MADTKDNPESLIEVLRQRVEALEELAQKQLSEKLPNRVSDLEESEQSDVEPIAKIDTRPGHDFSIPDDVLAWEIEFGNPYANISADSATILLRPCNQAGTEYDDARDVKVYVGTNRGSQGIADLGWTTSTILSFIRFSPSVPGSPNIQGVLIGEVSADAFAPGDVILTASTTLRDGFLWCHGAAVSRTTYAALFAKIGTTYGMGDGSTTFNVPDTRGRVPVGSFAGTGVVDGGSTDDLGDTGDYAAPGESGGKCWHGLAENNHPDHIDHYHEKGLASVGLGDNVLVATSGVTGWMLSGQRVSTTYKHGGIMHSWSGSGAEEHTYDDTDNRPPWLTFNYMIKT